MKTETVNVLNREDILAVEDIQIERVSVPEWGGDVFVKGMTGAERDRFEASVVNLESEGQKVNMVDLRAKLCSATMCDQNGKKLFTPADIKVLTRKSAIALQKVFTVAQRLSGITDDDVEDLAEGLEDSPFGDSASD